VNGRKVNISSYLVSENDEIEIKDSFKQSIPIIGATQSKEREVPEYIVADHKKMTAKFNKVPKYDQIPYVNISSYLVSENDEIEIKDSFKQSIPIIGATQSKEREVPEYIVADHKKMTAKFNKVPKYDQIPYPVQMEPKLVVEYYSR